MPNTLVVIINEHQVKDSVALDFMLEVLSVVKTEKGSSAVLTLLKRSGLDLMLDQLFPANKRTPENIKNSFISAGQPDIVTYLAGLENAGAKKDIQRSLRISISDEKPTKEIIMDLKVLLNFLFYSLKQFVFLGVCQEKWSIGAGSSGNDLERCDVGLRVE